MLNHSQNSTWYGLEMRMLRSESIKLLVHSITGATALVSVLSLVAVVCSLWISPLGLLSTLHHPCSKLICSLVPWGRVILPGPVEIHDVLWPLKCECRWCVSIADRVVRSQCVSCHAPPPPCWRLPQPFWWWSLFTLGPRMRRFCIEAPATLDRKMQTLFVVLHCTFGPVCVTA